MTVEMAESDLRSLAAKDIAAAAREDRNAVHRLRPYYFKRYSEYPSPEEIEVDIAEKDSQTSPYLAEVVIPKVRYATRLHRNRDDAAADQNYFRNTGSETISYEFRNGRWLRLGSLFHATKVEENVNGEWLPLREEVKQTLSESQQEQGWFSRSWYAITGR